MDNDEPTRAQLSTACTELARLWHTRAAINLNRLLDGYHDARLHTVNGLAAHAYRTGEVAARMIRDGFWLEASPLIRTSYECAVSAQWVAQVPDGTQALLNEDYRSRRNMAATLKQSEAWAAMGLDVPIPDDEDHESFSNAQALNFTQMCDDLSPGGAEAYAYYKVLCWFSHATNYVIDQYTTVVESDGMCRITLRRFPRAREDGSHTSQYLCAASLVWAASALDFLDVDHVHAAPIEQLARRVGVAPSMELSESARARLQREEPAI